MISRVHNKRESVLLSYPLLCTLDDILYDTSDYKVGCSDKWSNTFTMITLNTGTNWSPRLAIYGDMGSTNAQSLSRLIDETNAGHFDAILHIGES